MTMEIVLGMVGSFLLGILITLYINTLRKNTLAHRALPSQLSHFSRILSNNNNPKQQYDETFWEYIRTQYYLSYARIYLNTAGLGPTPKAVLDDFTNITYQQQELSDTGHFEMDVTREKMANFLGLTIEEANQISFTRNATESTSIIATGLQLQDGDEIIIDSQAHPGGSFAWLSYQKLKPNFVIKTFTPSSLSVNENIQRILSLITEKTRVIQVDHVTAPEGIRMPVEQIAQICIDRNIWFHVDGAQAIGMFPVNIKNIKCNSYAASCHKWLGAPHGTGFLYVNASNLNQLWPCEVGAYSDNGYRLSPPPTFIEYNLTSQRFEYGTRDTSSVAAIRTAIDFMNSIGMEEVALRGSYLSNYLKSKLAAIPGVTILSPYVELGSDEALHSSITTYSVEGVSAEELYSYLLNNYNLRCRIVTEDGLNALRVSTHIFNFPADCDLVAQGTATILQKKKIGYFSSISIVDPKLLD